MSAKANCILLKARGKQYYAEEFGRFIEIEDWEYDRILNNPNLYYFSTALKKHFEWCAAVGDARTLTFAEVLGQTHSAFGSPENETASRAELQQPTFEAANATRKAIACWLASLRERVEQCPIGLTNWILLCLTIAAVTVFVADNSRVPNHNVSSDSTVAQSPEIRRAIPVEPEIRRAIPVQPEIRKALPVDLDVSRPIAPEVTGLNANQRSVFTESLNGYVTDRGCLPKPIVGVRDCAPRTGVSGHVSS